jgi:hypothetical protein
MFDQLVTGTTGARGAAAVDAWSRVESAACARRLAAMVTMLDDAHAASDSAERDLWAIDNWSAVCAHIGAAQRLTPGVAANMLMIGVALRERFPRVGAVFADGLIDYRMVRLIVTRGALVIDPDALRALDAALATALRDWEPMSVNKTEHAIDAFIAQVDPLAVRRTQTSARNRALDIVIDEDGSGMAQVFGTLFAHDAVALDARVDAMADTVCPSDPRTRDQRRADAAGAWGHGADRLACLCGLPDCPAAALPPAGGVVVYVVAHHDTLDPTAPDGPAPEAPTPSDPEPEDADAQAHHDAHESRTDADFDATPEPGFIDPAEECAGLDGHAPPRFTTPLREMTVADLMTHTDPGQFSHLPPAFLMNGTVLPGAIGHRAALNARRVPIVHPGHAPPQSRYTPTKALADFVRCRDLTCRFPGCTESATNCDVDHTIPYPYGPTQASNLKCSCRRHHLLKTFWGGPNGWRDSQSPDGTVTWTAPDGRTHTTTPGSHELFPSLCAPTAPVITTGDPPPAHTAGLTMPRRRSTRAQDRTRRIHDERALNKTWAELDAAAREARAAADPPPF